MAVMSGQRKRSLKRSTWPQAAPGQLETIVESPKASEKLGFQSPSSPDAGAHATFEFELLDSKQNDLDKQTMDPSTGHSQMIWYSHHLAQSYTDRERLAGKIQQLESVCKYQSKTNARLLEDVQVWRNNYECVESELIEATQEMEEAKAYVRSVETANANLRDALSKLKDDKCTRRNKWRTCLQNLWDRLVSQSQHVGKVVCEASAITSASPLPDMPSRMVDMPNSPSSKMHLLGSRNCSRTSQLALQVPELRVSTPKKTD